MRFDWLPEADLARRLRVLNKIEIEKLLLTAVGSGIAVSSRPSRGRRVSPLTLSDGRKVDVEWVSPRQNLIVVQALALELEELD